MEQRIKIKHPGPRGWAGIAASAFDPAKHERIMPTGDIAALRAEYKAKIGKRPFMGWDADTLREKLNGADG